MIVYAFLLYNKAYDKQFFIIKIYKVFYLLSILYQFSLIMNAFVFQKKR